MLETVFCGDRFDIASASSVAVQVVGRGYRIVPGKGWGIFLLPQHLRH